MFLVTRTQIRPSTSVAFFGQDNSAISSETLTYIRENYIITGKQINTDRTISTDGLTLTISTTWQSEEAFTEYRNDQFVIDNLIDVSNAYCEANGITSTLVSKEQI
jgi:hypothetical protein